MNECTFCSTVNDLLLAIFREPLTFSANKVYWDLKGRLAIGKCELFKMCFGEFAGRSIRADVKQC